MPAQTVQLARTSITARRMCPTSKHRPAIVPGILGTVYAVNAQGTGRYFDYDLAGAYEWAGVTQEGDPRISVPPGRFSYVRSGDAGANPKVTDRCVWVLR